MDSDGLCASPGVDDDMRAGDIVYLFDDVKLAKSRRARGRIIDLPELVRVFVAHILNMTQPVIN